MVHVSASENSDFLGWWQNKENKSDREREMERSGIPLEIRARRILTKSGYRVSRPYYQKDGVSHETDFMAEKGLEEYHPLTSDEHDIRYYCLINFQLLLIGECKRTESNDFFAFQGEGSAANFPIRFYNEQFPTDFRPHDTSKYYGFENFTDRIVEVDSPNYKSRKSDNYNDRITYEAAEELVGACQFFRDDYIQRAEFPKNIVLETHRRGLTRYAQQFKVATVRGLVEHYLVDMPSNELWPRFFGRTVTFAIPMLVIDDNRGLVMTTLRDDGNVSFDSQIRSVVYSHVPQNVERLRSLSTAGAFPIVISQHSALEETVKMLESGTRSLIHKFKRELEDRPETYIAEILLSHSKDLETSLGLPSES